MSEKSEKELERLDIKELERLVREKFEELREKGIRPEPRPEPEKPSKPIHCEYSYANFPVGETVLHGWVYACDLNCPKKSLVESPHAKTMYCSAAEKFYKNVSLVLQHGEPVSFWRDYFIVRLPKGEKDHVKDCITKREGCENDYWFLWVRISPRIITFFTTDRQQLEELFEIQPKMPFLPVSGVEAVAHAVIESAKEVEREAGELMGTLEVQQYGRLIPGRALRNYAALSEALAQIMSSCMSFGSDFIRRNLRFMACGNFAPIPYLINIVRNMKQCEKAQDWNCMATWITELDDLIEAYRRPSPPYRPLEGEKDIFRFYETAT